ncbi:MAG TPA: hypothetical protein VED41_04310 [Solirubrobacteraceae bacterium]|nr:hypothetical protein [Solirubrobacteraceae bacterium]
MTWLEWLRTPAAGSSPTEILTALEKLEYLRLLGGERVDLSMLAPGRVRMLAVEGHRRAAWRSRGCRPRAGTRCSWCSWRRCLSSAAMS